MEGLLRRVSGVNRFPASTAIEHDNKTRRTFGVITPPTLIFSVQSLDPAAPAIKKTAPFVVESSLGAFWDAVQSPSAEIQLRPSRRSPRRPINPWSNKAAPQGAGTLKGNENPSARRRTHGAHFGAAALFFCLFAGSRKRSCTGRAFAMAAHESQQWIHDAEG